MPSEWVTALTAILSNSNDALVAEAVAVVRSVPLPESGTDDLTKALLPWQAALT